MDAFSDSEYSDGESANEEEIAIIMNVHMPQQEGQRQRFDPFYRQNQKHQFHPTNPICLPQIVFKPPQLDAVKDDEDPKPWRETPKLMPDYFNYGFTELVWEAYKFKQQALRRMFSEKSGGRRH